MTASLLLIFLLPITVDRIEPPMAVVEWPWGELSDVPLEQLPPNLREGTRLQVVYPLTLSCSELSVPMLVHR